MTTKVTIDAHCAPEKEARMVVTDGDEVVEDILIQDGETIEQYVYDGREISVKEVEK